MRNKTLVSYKHRWWQVVARWTLIVILQVGKLFFHLNSVFKAPLGSG